MMRKIKKEASSPPVVTLDSDSDVEFVKIYKDNVVIDVSLENNRIMIADLCALFPNFHGIQLVGNGLNRFLSKTRFADRGFFPAPTTGWTGIKITVLVVEAAATATSESMTSTPTPRITPIPIETASNIEPTEDCERFKPVKQQEISTPPSCNPVQITDEDIFHRFNVANISELYSLPQFLNDSFFSHQLFLSYRDNFMKVFRGTLMALGPESFHLSTVFSLSNRSGDFVRLLNSLDVSKSIVCKVCDEITFTEPQSAFQHYCSIAHGKKHLIVNKIEATEVRDILKLAKEKLMFPPPFRPLPLMSKLVRPPTLLHAAPPFRPTTPSMNFPRQSRWDIRPASVPMIRPPVLPQLVQMQRIRLPMPDVPVSHSIRLPGGNFACAPTLPILESLHDGSIFTNNNNTNAETQSSSATNPRGRIKREKRMRQVSEESESDSEEESRPNVPRKAPSQAKKQRPNNDAVVEPRRPATTNDERSNNRAQNVPVVRDSSDSESSDFEAIAHRRPIKGEFGEANICRDPQIPEKELFFHYGVKSITELRKLRQMVVPHLINDLDDFHKFRNFVITNLRNVLVKASKVERLMFVLFLASKADIPYTTLDKNAKSKCSICKEQFTLKHILSKKHVLLYREKYFSDPEEILVLLEPKNQKYYASGDERAFVLRDFNVHSYELLKVKPQFYRNRFYKENTSAFGALKDALIQRLKLTNLRIDPRFFWLEKMLFLKYEGEKNEKLFPLLMEIFSDYERKCSACDVKISSWIHYMKHIISKSHIRKELTQAQLNLILNSMRLIKDTEDGYEVVPLVQRKNGARQRHFTDSSNGESSDDSSPPEDPCVQDVAARLIELKSRYKALNKHKKPSVKQRAEKQKLLDEIANLEK